VSHVAKNTVGPVDNSNSSKALYKTLRNGDVQITDGFWANRQSLNRQVSLKHGYVMLNKYGNLQNLKLAAGMVTGSRVGRNFSDETVYKWLEALAWELGRASDDELQDMADEVISVITAAQEPDGYLNSYYQVMEPDNRWEDLDFGHELYCAGHLIQAAIAFKRAVDDDRLLTVACKFADYIGSVFGPGKKEGTSGHPGIEMALVELFRTTEQERYLQLAQFFLDQRGKHSMKGEGAAGPKYHQDHVTIREAEEVAGHAVRQTYLATGVADLYMETGEQSLLDAAQRLWADMTGGKLYITGGIGSRYDGESFGESYELPPDQCYCETCAAIGNLFWNWRMLLISGESRYADLIERLLFNGILSSPGLDGTSFFYANSLMLRDGKSIRLSTNPAEEMIGSLAGRPEWHSVACCPPNVMRLMSSLQTYFVTQDANGLQIHQYGNLQISTSLENTDRLSLSLITGYPWDQQVKVKIQESADRPWRLALRIPGWCRSFSIKVNGQTITPDIKKGYVIIEQVWKAGDEIDIEFSMPPVFIEPHPRIDAVRHCVALQRGPIVYCLEEQDQTDMCLLDVSVDPSGEVTSRWHDDLLGGVLTLELEGFVLDGSNWSKGENLYRQIESRTSSHLSGRKVTLTAVPYYIWGNRGLKSMRVWIPRAD
jgi:DUF1680 family protein